MLIDSILISAFRGIRTEINLDLTARITLIHAANGTGKTSICDATEWLLTDEVHRLVNALRESPTGGIRNLFAEGRETFVKAQLRFGNATLNLRRTGTGHNTKLEQAGPDWRNLNQNTLIEQLAPSNLPAGSTRQQNLNRAAWFRAVRLLEASDLELLLDDTDDAQKVRGLLFSNLFGISELQSREQILEKIRDAMTPPRRLQAEAARLRTEIQDIESRLSFASARASEPFLATARQHLENAGRYLEANLEINATPNQLTSTLQNVQLSQEDRLSRARSSLETMTREWDRFHALTAELSALEQEQEGDVIRLNQMRSQKESLAAAAQSSSAVVGQCVQQENRLRALIPEQLLSALNNALTQWRNAAADPNEHLDIAALRVAEQRAIAQQELLERQRAAFASCAQNIPRWLELQAELRAAETRITELELPTPDTVVANDRALGDAQEQLRRIEAESERLAAPLERLRTEGRRMLDSLPDEHRCPLCAHDYETSARLRAAIDASLEALPTVLAALATQKTAQEAIAADATERKRRWAEITVERERLNRLIADSRDKLRAAMDELGRTGVEIPNLSHPEFLHNFQAAETAFERSAEAGRQNQSRMSALRLAGDVLGSVLETILATSETLRTILPEATGELMIATAPPSQWPGEVERLAAGITAALQQAAQKSAAARNDADAKQQNSDTLSNQIASLSAAMESRAAHLSELRLAVLRLKEEWSIAAGEIPPTKDALDALPEHLARSADRLAKSAAEINSAIENTRKAEEASERERQTIANRNKLGELREALQRLERIERRRSELDRAVTLLRQAKERFISSQIQPLCSVITALYRRAQSNPFVTAIGTDDRGGAHRWTANADDCRLEAIAQLSQGQRQDFALAVFLARARDVRGTFFLDEPLLHLDDLNRVALLDILRVLVLEVAASPLKLVITTASNALVRHFREKFSLLSSNGHGPALRVYCLSGNPRAGVTSVEE